MSDNFVEAASSRFQCAERALPVAERIRLTNTYMAR
jgi:hypothetical protein